MSELPAFWATAEVGDFLSVNYGKALAANSRAEGGRVPVFGSSGLVGYHDSALVSGACIVVGRKGAAGVVHLVRESCWPIDTAYFIQPPDELGLDYLYYFFASQPLGQLDKSTAIPSLSRDDLYRVRVPIAPRAEQARIVEKLEALLADLDAGVAELKAAQRKLAQYRQSLLKAAMDGSLTAGWRAAHTPERLSSTAEGWSSGEHLLQRILQERRARFVQKHGGKKKYPEPVAPDVSQLPELPEGWVWATIDQLAHVGTGVTPLRSKREYFDDGTIPWTTSGALNEEIVASASEFVTELAIAECRLELYPAGSLLVAMYGEGKTRGKCSELGFASTVNQAIAALVFEESSIAVRPHVKIFLLDAYEAMRKQASGGVQPNLNLQIIKSLCVPLPPLAEQHAILAHLDTALAACKQQEQAIAHGLKLAAAQRRNLLRAAFAGQLVPQDPNDEPASALLERIRAEKAGNAGERGTKKNGKRTNSPA